MKKIFFLSVLMFIITTPASIAQSLRIVEGCVVSEDGKPLSGAILKFADSSQTFNCDSTGKFSIKIPYNLKYVSAHHPDYTPTTIEIDGSYLILRLKYNTQKAYAKFEAQQDSLRAIDARSNISKNVSIREKGFWIDVSLETGTEYCLYQNSKGQFVEPYSNNGHTTYGATIAFGYRITPQIAVGGGFGINSQIKNDVIKVFDPATIGEELKINNCIEYRALTLPVFFRIHYDILSTLVSPYINLDLGYAIPDIFAVRVDGSMKLQDPEGRQLKHKHLSATNYCDICTNGLFAKVDIGVSFKIEQGFRLYVGCKSGVQYVNTLWYDKQTQPKNWLVIPLMAKIGFEF